MASYNTNTGKKSPWPVVFERCFYVGLFFLAGPVLLMCIFLSCLASTTCKYLMDEE